MDATPISNISYLEYLYSTKLYDRECQIAYVSTLTSHIPVDGPKKYFEQNCYRGYLDSTVVPPRMLMPRLMDEDGTLAFVDLYLKHPAFHNYPLLGCTRQQAMDYCRWRTAMVKILFYIGYTDNDRPVKAYENFEYRLPYYHELVSFAQDYKLQGKFYKAVEELDLDTIALPVLTPYASKPKKRKASFSNIHEYIQSDDSLFYVLETDTGLAFFHQMDTLNIGKRHTGFRCVCEVKE